MARLGARARAEHRICERLLGPWIPAHLIWSTPPRNTATKLSVSAPAGSVQRAEKVLVDRARTLPCIGSSPEQAEVQEGRTSQLGDHPSQGMQLASHALPRAAASMLGGSALLADIGQPHVAAMQLPSPTPNPPNPHPHTTPACTWPSSKPSPTGGSPSTAGRSVDRLRGSPCAAAALRQPLTARVRSASSTLTSPARDCAEAEGVPCQSGKDAPQTLPARKSSARGRHCAAHRPPWQSMQDRHEEGVLPLAPPTWPHAWQRHLHSPAEIVLKYVNLWRTGWHSRNQGTTMAAFPAKPTACALQSASIEHAGI